MTRPARLVLLGHPVAHSLSPRFQQAALDAAGIPLRYEALDVPPARLADVLGRLAVESAAGNVTIPHKEAVHAQCATLTEVARRTGAVNAFRADAAGLHGHNTDVGGVDAAVRRLIGDPTGARVVVLGAGGAAAATLVAAATWRAARVTVLNRTVARAHALVGRVGIGETADHEAALADADLVVNATSVGLHDDAHPAPLGELSAGAAVLDLVYRRGETGWVRDARASGRRAADGTGMLLEQGALAFEWWLGVPPDREVMRRALEG